MDTPQQSDDENKLIAERRAKLAVLREQGPAFPNDFRRTALAGNLQRDFAQHDKSALEAANEPFSVAGRLIRNQHSLRERLRSKSLCAYLCYSLPKA